MNAEVPYAALGLSQEAFGTNSLHGQFATQVVELIDKKSKTGIRISGKEPAPVDYHQEAITQIANWHNEVANLYNIFPSPDIPGIFENQEQFDTFAQEGIGALSPDQVKTAQKIMEAEQKTTETLKERAALRRKKSEEAEAAGDLSSYLMWQVEMANTNFNSTWERTTVLYQTVANQDVETTEQYSQRIETVKKQYDAEARLVRRMHGQITKLPDGNKVKVAIMRLPAEVDKSRPSRALMQAPANSITRWGKDVPTKVPAMETWTVSDAACINHSFDSLYKLTRRPLPSGQFEPRAFYVTAQSPTRDAPVRTGTFLEVSFADSSELLPPTRDQVGKEYFQKNPAIVQQDLVQNLVLEEGQMHFILGYDDFGGRITQDAIPYVMDSLAGGVSNAFNIRVGQFFE